MKNKFPKLKTPAAIQDFLNSIPFNFEKKGETVLSPRRVLQENKAHCCEGAILGAYLLSRLGHKPLIMCLFGKRPDFDHVIAPFQMNGYWGALSKTNHAVLRYREPVYKTIRELVMSYFHEYFLHTGKKTLYAYSELLDLNKFSFDWINSENNLWEIDEKLDKIKKHLIIPKSHKKLRAADAIEIKAGKISEWRK